MGESRKEREYWSSLPVTPSVLFHFIIGGGDELIHGVYMETRGYFYRVSSLLSPLYMVFKLSDLQGKLFYLPSHFANSYNFSFKFRPVL